MSRARGLALQNALARYLQAWWPSAESAGAGRNGRDILGTPGVAFENKTSFAGTSPRAALKQAVQNAGDYQLPVLVYWPPRDKNSPSEPGVGARRPHEAIAMLPLPHLMQLLEDAGYAPERKDQTA